RRPPRPPVPEDAARAGRSGSPSELQRTSRQAGEGPQGTGGKLAEFRQRACCHGTVLELPHPAVARLVAERLQEAREALEEGLGEGRRELAAPLGDGARADVPVAEPRQAAEQAVLPEAPGAHLLLPGV